MKQLCATLQAEFGDCVICTVSPYSQSIYIVPSHDHDIITRVDILRITQYCIGHNLGFYFYCHEGCIVVYYSKVSEFISKHKLNHYE